jgi:YegS/Rv2252/BmrU family lipid kinase
MDNQTNVKAQKIYVVLNPIAGHSIAGDIHQVLEQHFGGSGWTYEVYETTGEENLTEITRAACQNGADMVVAAGGDGTVSGVVSGLVHTDVPLGIIPVGTGNGLARAMGIPLDPEEAIRLLAGEHSRQCLDAMQVGEEYFVLNVSAGISSRAMRDTKPEDKRRLGVVAYAQNILNDVMQAKTNHFQLTLDGHTVNVEAAEILVANGKVLKEGSPLFGSREAYSDGQLEVNILTAYDAADYIKLAWDVLVDAQESDKVHDLTVHDRILLDVAGKAMPVQADGELIGKTPVEVILVPKALIVVVPSEST